MGVLDKALTELSSLTNKFWQFGDGKTAPGHVRLDPFSGKPSAAPVGGYSSLDELLRREGFRPFPRTTPYGSIGVTDAPTTLQSGAGVALGARQDPFTNVVWDMWVDGLTITTTQDMILQLDINANVSGYSGTKERDIIRFALKAYTPTFLPLRALWRGAESPGLNFSCIISAAAAVTLYWDLHGTVISDANLSAAQSLLWTGDSITNGTGAGIYTDPLARAKWFPWMTRTYLRDVLGNDLRLVNKSVSASTTTDHEQSRQAGVYDLANIGVLAYSAGPNDAAAGVATATMLANVQAMFAWLRKNYPSATMLVFGPTPAENNTTEANLAAYRAALSAWVAADTTGKLRYCNLGSTFDRTQGTTVYLTTDSAGNRIHPNPATQFVIGQAIQAYLAANPITLT